MRNIRGQVIVRKSKEKSSNNIFLSKIPKDRLKSKNGTQCSLLVANRAKSQSSKNLYLQQICNRILKATRRERKKTQRERCNFFEVSDNSEEFEDAVGELADNIPQARDWSGPPIYVKLFLDDFLTSTIRDSVHCVKTMRIPKEDFIMKGLELIVSPGYGCEPNLTVVLGNCKIYDGSNGRSNLTKNPRHSFHKVAVHSSTQTFVTIGNEELTDTEISYGNNPSNFRSIAKSLEELPYDETSSCTFRSISPSKLKKQTANFSNNVQSQSDINPVCLKTSEMNLISRDSNPNSLEDNTLSTQQPDCSQSSDDDTLECFLDSDFTSQLSSICSSSFSLSKPDITSGHNRLMSKVNPEIEKIKEAQDLSTNYFNEKILNENPQISNVYLVAKKDFKNRCDIDESDVDLSEESMIQDVSMESNLCLEPTVSTTQKSAGDSNRFGCKLDSEIIYSDTSTNEFDFQNDNSNLKGTGDVLASKVKYPKADPPNIFIAGFNEKPLKVICSITTSSENANKGLIAQKEFKIQADKIANQKFCKDMSRENSKSDNNFSKCYENEIISQALENREKLNMDITTSKSENFETLLECPGNELSEVCLKFNGLEFGNSKSVNFLNINDFVPSSQEYVVNSVIVTDAGPLSKSRPLTKTASVQTSLDALRPKTTVDVSEDPHLELKQERPMTSVSEALKGVESALKPLQEQLRDIRTKMAGLKNLTYDHVLNQNQMLNQGQFFQETNVPLPAPANQIALGFPTRMQYLDPRAPLNPFIPETPLSLDCGLIDRNNYLLTCTSFKNFTSLWTEPEDLLGRPKFGKLAANQENKFSDQL